jgi:hypothetical protein
VSERCVSLMDWNPLDLVNKKIYNLILTFLRAYSLGVTYTYLM